LPARGPQKFDVGDVAVIDFRNAGDPKGRCVAASELIVRPTERHGGRRGEVRGEGFQVMVGAVRDQGERRRATLPGDLQLDAPVPGRGAHGSRSSGTLRTSRATASAASRVNVESGFSSRAAAAWSTSRSARLMAMGSGP